MVSLPRIGLAPRSECGPRLGGPLPLFISLTFKEEDAMGIRAWHKVLFALVPGLVLATTTMAAEYGSARSMTLGPPLPPPDIELAEPEEIVINPGYTSPTPGYYAGVPSCEVPSYGAYPGCATACGSGCDIVMNCCECCDRWTIRAGAVIMRREGGADVPIVTGTPSYSTADLDFGYSGGPAISVIRHGFLGTCWDLEVNYFGVYSQATAATADADTVNAVPVINVLGVTPTSTLYDARLHSTEINLRRQWNNWLTVLGGFRWIELGDDLNTDMGPGIATFGMDVNNHIYGAQIGVDACLLERGAFRLEGFAKAGVYGNSADVAAATTGIGGALPLSSVTGNDTVFVGDVALTGVYQLNNCWSVRGGYQLLWIDGVALAPNQLDGIDISTGAGAVDTDSTAFYHGFTIGAEYRF